MSYPYCTWTSHMVLAVKNLPPTAGDIRDTNLIPGWEDPWRRAWQCTPVFLPGEVNGQRSLAGYCLWGRTGLDKTEGTWHSTAHAACSYIARCQLRSHCALIFIGSMIKENNTNKISLSEDLLYARHPTSYSEILFLILMKTL